MDDNDLAAMLERLRAQGSDDGNVEVKASEGRLSKDVWDSVSAFANTSGGTVILGVREERHGVAGGELRTPGR